MLPILPQTIYLGLAVLLTYGWTHNPNLSGYNLQISALLIIVYFAMRFFVKSTRLFTTESTLILVMVTLLLVFSTGGLISPLFFLLDFLLFALVLLFEPTLTAVLATVIVFIFIGDVFLGDKNLDLTGVALTNLLSLVLITPLALMFGRKYLTMQQEAGRITVLEEEVGRNQTDTLLWVSTQARPDLIKILDGLGQVIGSNQLPHHLQAKLKTIYSELIALGKSANALENEIKKDSEKI